MTSLAQAWQRARDVAGWPRRMIRRRISLQLVASHILVVLLTLVTVEAAAIAALFGLAPDLIFPDGWDIDGTVGEKARAVAYRLDPAVVAAAAAGDLDARTALGAELRGFLPQNVSRPEMPGISAVGGGDPVAPWPAAMTLERVAGGLVVGPDGTILASTDPNLAVPGQSIETAAPLVGRATAAAYAAAGEPIKYGEVEFPYALEFADHVTAGSHPIFSMDGQIVGYVTLQGQPFDITEYAPAGELLRTILRAEARTLGIVTLAGILISIPVAIWRARLVSRRMKRLAVAADAMASGDLSHSVKDQGEDEIARVAERFDDMRQRLAESDRARRAFVANVSHDLRTPVAIVQGHLERLLNQGDEGDGGGRRGDGSSPPSPPSVPVEATTLELLYRETATLSRLIDDLFTLARVEETSLPLEVRSVPVAQAAAEAVAGLKALAWEQSKVTVLSLVEEDVPAVRADPTRLRQILNNLLYNALRYTPSGGLVVVNARPDGARVEFSVADTGVGIPPDERESVFDRFYSGARSSRSPDGGEATAGGPGGSGLGLNIVKQLVEAMGGAIRVESESGQGTVFRFALPRA